MHSYIIPIYNTNKDQLNNLSLLLQELQHQVDIELDIIITIAVRRVDEELIKNIKTIATKYPNVTIVEEDTDNIGWLCNIVVQRYGQQHIFVGSADICFNDRYYLCNFLSFCISNKLGYCIGAQKVYTEDYELRAYIQPNEKITLNGIVPIYLNKWYFIGLIKGFAELYYNVNYLISDFIYRVVKKTNTFALYPAVVFYLSKEINLNSEDDNDNIVYNYLHSNYKEIENYNELMNFGDERDSNWKSDGKDITIFVTTKNRTTSLINNLIDSLNKCEDKDKIELSIYDQGTTDVPSLYDCIRQHWDGKLVYNEEKSDRSFEKSYGLNKAVNQCSSDYIFCCDADMSLPVDFVKQYYKNVNKFSAWFPICFSLAKNKPRVIDENNGWWRATGFGLAGMYKNLFIRIGGYDEKYKRWGKEDDDLFERVTVIKIRDKCIGIFHNWHPSVYNLITFPEKFKEQEGTRILIAGITTYNRLDFLKKCIESWDKTRNRSYYWYLIIADDGSTDGTKEYLRSLNLESTIIRLIFNERKGVHYQTNSILKYSSNIKFDYGFKMDDDIIFLKKGWDDLYINAIEKTRYDHLCFFEIDRGKRRKRIREVPIYSSNMLLCSYGLNEDLQGAFWTFTSRVIKKVGFFDEKNFGFCGYGHIDYTLRCARAGFNDINNIYDCNNSNEYITLNETVNYRPAIPYEQRRRYNSPKVIAHKLKLINKKDRITVGIDTEIKNSNIDFSIVFLFHTNDALSTDYLMKYVNLLEKSGKNIHIVITKKTSDKYAKLKNVSFVPAKDIKSTLKDCKILVINNWSLLESIKDLNIEKKYYFISHDEINSYNRTIALRYLNSYIDNVVCITDSQKIKVEMLLNYNIQTKFLNNKNDILSIFNLYSQKSSSFREGMNAGIK